MYSVTPLSVNDMLYDSTYTLLRGSLQSVSTYNKNPFQGAAYIQDKMELAKTLYS